MKKLLTLLLCLLLLPAAYAEDETQINRQCRFYSNARYTELLGRLNDASYNAEVTVKAKKEHYVYLDTRGRKVKSAQVCFGETILPFKLQQKNEGEEWVTIAEQTDCRFAQVFLAFDEICGKYRFVFGDGENALPLTLREIFLYTEEAPESAHIWQENAGKADLMTIVAHPDDELLWLGGTIPWYAGEQNLHVQAVYMTCGQMRRRLELLDGLWVCGVREYPTIGTFSDGRNKDINAAYNRWGREETYRFIVEQLRKYRPDVVVTHDVEGEYGHPQHLVTSDAVLTAVSLAADPAYDAESAALYGTWQVKKLYRHLGDTPTTILDWSRTMTAFGGKTGFQIARAAFACHQSQTVDDRWQVAYKGSLYDSTLYTLVFSTVGDDVNGDDFFENIR